MLHEFDKNKIRNAEELLRLAWVAIKDTADKYEKYRNIDTGAKPIDIYTYNQLKRLENSYNFINQTIGLVEILVKANFQQTYKTKLKDNRERLDIINEIMQICQSELNTISSDEQLIFAIHSDKFPKELVQQHEENKTTYQAAHHRFTEYKEELNKIRPITI